MIQDARQDNVGELRMAEVVGPTVEPRLEYLMTLLGEHDPPQLVDEATRIVNVKGGWVKGPRISGMIIAPAGTGFACCHLEVGVSMCD
jgi:hypothetical protein